MGCSLTEHRPVLEVVGGSIAFGGNQALDSVSFAMTKYQLVGLIGPNGSGKTTLLNATSGIYPLDSGSIRFEGRPIEKTPPHAIARAGVARTFQIARIFPRMTARAATRSTARSSAPATALSNMSRGGVRRE